MPYDSMTINELIQTLHVDDSTFEALMANPNYDFIQEILCYAGTTWKTHGSYICFLEKFLQVEAALWYALLTINDEDKDEVPSSQQHPTTTIATTTTAPRRPNSEKVDEVWARAAYQNYCQSINNVYLISMDSLWGHSHSNGSLSI